MNYRGFTFYGLSNNRVTACGRGNKPYVIGVYQEQNALARYQVWDNTGNKLTGIFGAKTSEEVFRITVDAALKSGALKPEWA